MSRTLSAMGGQMGFWEIFKKSLPVLGGAAAGALTGGLLAPAAAAGTAAAVGGVAGAAPAVGGAIAPAAAPVVAQSTTPGMFDGIGRDLAKQTAGTLVAGTLNDQLNRPKLPGKVREVIRSQQAQRPQRGIGTYDNATRNLG